MSGPTREPAWCQLQVPWPFLLYQGWGLSQRVLGQSDLTRSCTRSENPICSRMGLGVLSPGSQ